MAERIIPEKYKGLPIYSISRLDNYRNCKQGYHLKYNLKKEGKQNVYSFLGTKIHELLELLQFGKISNEDALNKFRGAMFECFNIHGYNFASEKIKQNFEYCIEHCLKNYKPIPCTNFKSEMEFFTDIPYEDRKIVLMGYIDGVILYENKDNDGNIISHTVEVVDYKTSSKYTGKDLDEHGKQLVLYAYALEKEYKISVSEVKWNMLKYCWISWDNILKSGKTSHKQSFSARHEIVKTLYNELKKDLRTLSMSEIEIELILEKAVSENNMSLLPQSVQYKYSISDGFVSYPYTEQTKQELIDYIINIVNEIESKDKTIESEWTAKEITDKTSFFCNTLCDCKAHCQAYSNYLISRSQAVDQKVPQFTMDKLEDNSINVSLQDQIFNLFQ
jgi:predicted DNA-binding transcriptional regulator